MKKIYFLFVTLLFLSCSKEEEFKKIEVKNYALQLPSYLSKTNDLNDDASLQYQNPFRELYIIVIDESKQEVEQAITLNELEDIYSNDFNGYVELLTASLESNIAFKNKKEKDTVINSLEAKLLKFEGKIEDYDVFYEIAFVNGVTNYYQIMTWTLLNRKSDYEAVMDKMIYSFKVAGQTKANLKGAKK